MISNKGNNKMNIYILNNNEDMGFICYEHDDDHHLSVENRRVVAQYWAKDMPIKKVWFSTKKSFYDFMKIFVSSNLVEHTELHKAKAWMAAEYIEYYDKNML